MLDQYYFSLLLLLHLPLFKTKGKDKNKKKDEEETERKLIINKVADNRINKFPTEQKKRGRWKVDIEEAKREGGGGGGGGCFASLTRGI